MARKDERLTSVEENTLHQRRWGCTCGCLAFIVAVIFGTLAVFYFALKPYPEIRPGRWIHAKTVGFGVLRLTTADAGLSDFFTFLSTELEQKWGQKLKDNERRALRSALVLARQSPDWMVRPSIYVFVEKDSPAQGEQSAVVITQFRHFFGYLLGRSLLLSLGLQPEAVSPTQLTFRFGKEEKSPGSWLVLTHQLLVWSSQEVRADVPDLTQSHSLGGAPSDTFMTYYGELNAEKPEPGEDLAFVLVNEGERLTRALGTTLETLGGREIRERVEQALAQHGVSLAEVNAVRLSADLTSADRVKARAWFYADQPATIKKLGDAAKILEGLSTPPGSKSVAGVRVESRASRNSVALNVEAWGLRQVIQAMMDNLTKGNRRSLPSGDAKEGGTTQP